MGINSVQHGQASQGAVPVRPALQGAARAVAAAVVQAAPTAIRPAGMARNKPIADAVSKGMNHGLVVGFTVADAAVVAGYLVGKHHETKQQAP